MSGGTIRVLFVSDDTDACAALSRLSGQVDQLVLDAVSSRNAALSALQRERYSVLIVDAELERDHGLDALGELCATGANPAGILLVPTRMSSLGAEALRRGAGDWLYKENLTAAELKHGVARTHALRSAGLERAAQSEFDRLTIAVSKRFITLNPDQLDIQAQQTLASLGTALRADRCFIIRINEHSRLLRLAYEWCAPEVPSGGPISTAVSPEGIDWLTAELRNQGLVSVRMLGDLPRETGNLAELLAARSVSSFVLVPLNQRELEAGVLGVSCLRPGVEFADESLRLLRGTAEILGYALERNRMLESLRESELRHRTLIESLFEGVLYCDAENRILQVNSRMCELSGYLPEELLGKFAHETLVPPEESAAFHERTRRRLQGIPEQYEFRIRRKDGSIFWSEISAVPIRDSYNRIIGTLGAVTDITQRKQAEEESLKLQRQLLHSQKMEAIGQLAAGVAHDLNNALSAVIGHLQLLRVGSSLPAEDRRSVDIAMQGCERALSQIEQLLGFSRQSRSNLRELPVKQVIDDTLAFLSRVLGDGVQIQYRGSAEGLRAELDQSQFQQVLTNLLLNARQAMPGGGVITFRFSTRYVDNPERFNSKARAGEYIVIGVHDTGAGIPSELIDKIFEPFFTTKSDQGGSGLGLAMVYSIMQRHGGWIEVQSEPGKGSTFSLHLPRVEREEKLQPAPLPLRTTRAKQTILVIDDEPILVDLMKRFLELAGFAAVGFTSPEEAVQWYEGNYGEIDLIVLDMKMARMDGRICFERLRAVNSEARVAILSGYMQDSSVQDLLSRGALRFFQKPLRYPEIVQWVEQVLAG